MASLILPRHCSMELKIRFAKNFSRISSPVSSYFTGFESSSEVFRKSSSNPLAASTRDTSILIQMKPMGLRLLREALGDIEGGTLVRLPQDESLATWEPSWERAPIPRPDLLQIGNTLDGYRVVTSLRDSGPSFSSPTFAD